MLQENIDIFQRYIGFPRKSSLVHPVSAWLVEAAVLWFPDEFSEQDRQAAEWRLCQARERAK